MSRKTSLAAVSIPAILSIGACQSVQPNDQALRVVPAEQVRHGAASQPDALYAVGRYHQGQVRYDKAIEAYNRLLADYPGHAEARNSLAVILALQGNYDAAIGEFEKAAANAPQSASIRNNLGYAYMLRGRVPEAIAVLRTAAQLDPANQRVRDNLDAALALGGKDKTRTLVVGGGDTSRDGNQQVSQDGGPEPRNATGAGQSLPPLQGEGWGGDGVLGAESRRFQPHPPPVLPLEGGGTPLPAVRAIAQATADAVRSDKIRLITVAENVFALQFPTPATEKAVSSIADPLRQSAGQNPPKPAANSAPGKGKGLRIEVSNGNGISGLARRTSEHLEGSGYRKARLTNELPYRMPATEIQYRPGFEPQARDFQLALRTGIPLVASRNLRSDVQLRLLLGKDVKSVPEVVAAATSGGIKVAGAEQ